MNRSLIPLLSLLFASVLSSSAWAVEYYELEVYGYQTPAHHELELENTTSMSSDETPALDNHILRSTFEFSYGWTDSFETTAYLDYTQPADDAGEYTAFRGHARTRFFEKGELPVDLGAYFEVELPRNYAQKDVGFEFRPILEKDLPHRFVFRLNPQVELSHVAVDPNTTVVTLDPDEAPTTAVMPSTPKQWLTEWGVASSLAYNWNDRIQPHVDWHYGFNDLSSLLIPSVDVNLKNGFKATAGVGFGLSSTTEQRLIVARLEYELYLF